LYQTAYHIIIDNTRNRKHFAPQGELLDGMEGKDSTAEDAEKKHNLHTLQVAIYANLTEEQKHVIILRFLEGFDLRETAAVLGKEINNIKVIQNRAITKLRESLASTLTEADK
jgi:RNA polymerase sigma factor (sigma-70 family)